MSDLLHQFGGDLVVGATGDLATATGTDLGDQRILRRLLTNVGDYIWNLDYGTGLASFIGEPGSALSIRALIRSQIFKETAVARSPEPIIDLQIAPNSSPTIVYVSIRYVDAPTGQTQALSFSLGA